MSISLTLMGGPPWGLRLSADERMRPTVCKILPGGRANVGGVRIGDVVDTINNEVVESVEDVYKKISESKNTLNIGLIRDSDSYHQTIRREKLSTSAHSSPITIRKELPSPTSVPSSPILPRANPFHTNSSPLRQIRLDLEGIRGATQNKRQLFEQICSSRSPATDRLLQRKIQMGFQQGLPSESTTTGYDSVCADFAGGSISDIHSGRSSPNSSLNMDDVDRTLLESRVCKSQTSRENGGAMTDNLQMEEMRVANSNPDWGMRTDIQKHNPAEGDVEVPGRRSVAALRQAITDKLEMKTPTAGSRPKTPSSNHYSDGRETPTWSAASIKVFEGLEDNRPYLGRVLDGPVAPTKYFQGVPPPSYHLSYTPQSTEPHSKPPLPPVVPPKPNKAVTIHESGEEPQSSHIIEPVRYEQNSFLNSIARNDDIPEDENFYEEKPPSTYIVRDSPRGNNQYTNKPSSQDQYKNSSSISEEKPSTSYPNQKDDEKSNQTASEFYHSLYEGGSERRINDIPSQNNANVTPADRAFAKVFPDVSCTSTINDPRIEHSTTSSEPMTTSCLTYFDDDMTNSQQSFTQRDGNVSMDSPPEDPKCSPKNGVERRQSMDLETSELLKSRSPAPFGTYSSSSGDHFATLRRRQYSPVTPVLSTPSSDDLLSPAGTKVYSYTDDSGFMETPSFKDNTSFDSASVTSPQRDDGTFSVMSSESRRPESFMSYSTQNDGTAPYNGLNTTPSSHPAPISSVSSAEHHLSEEKPLTEDEILLRQQRIAQDDLEQMSEMSSWYRNMFKKMHRLDDHNESVLKYQLREQAPTANNISRPITPNTFVSRPPSRFECEITPRRAKSVGRVVEPSSDKPSSTNLATEIAELKRISKEEMMYRQKAERLTEELQQERQRRHGFIPSASPALQKNFDRFESLMNNYGSGEVPAESNRMNSVQTATAIYKFVAKGARELPLNKGDIIRIHREIDSNWMEGERNGKVGIFPSSYVQIDDDVHSKKNKMRAVYPFTARNSNEMSLKLGELITYRRDIDANWAEGSNHIGEIGIFPKCYVRLLDDAQETSSVVPDRPKTPKIGSTPGFEADYEREPAKEIQIREPILEPIPEIRRETYHDSLHSLHPQNQRDLLPEAKRVMQHDVHRGEIQTDAHRVIHVEPQRTYQSEQHKELHPDIQRDLHPDIHRDLHRELQADYQRETQPMIQRDIKRVQTISNGQSENFNGNKSLMTRDSQSFEEKPQMKPQAEWQHDVSASNFSQSQPSKTQNSYAGLASLIPRGSETYRAVYAYKSQKEDELDLEVDDIIFVVEKCDDGWFIGTLLRTGQFGTFPGNYVLKH
ncbi:unnamed protein product [Auanema sp. JU1783]|nr:unnamed protein product [Auanema sp. JU1783]